MSTFAVQRVSECFIKPQHPTKESNQICYLTPWDLAALSISYIQHGLLFKKPTNVADNQDSIQNLLDKLKHSLSQTLFHFYPLVGRLVTQKTQDPPSYVVFVDCSNSDGAKFIYATVDLTISDILSSVYVPPIVQSLFDHHKAINHDGHAMPLLSIQVTELVDGVFIGCSMNHAVADGTSFWNFFNTWSEIFQAQAQGHECDFPISHQPVIKRWFPEGCDPLINLPFKHHDEFIRREEPLLVRERIFHISAESIAKLKAKANSESNTTQISSFQSLSALVWRSITRARGLPHEKRTSCKFAINNRTRMEPPLSPEYFGNAIDGVGAETTAGELLENNLGWAAWKLHLAVANYNNTVAQQKVEQWLQRPMIYQLGWSFYSSSVTMGNSPRFNVYGIEFGTGKAVAVRNGHAIKFDGYVSSYPGREGGGSVDLEVCLFPENMTALESDEEWMNAVSVSNPLS
ncbi:protein ENHANCED PSEUDOMONAS SUSCEPTIBILTY 1-like [Abrus precatorius]|uniref:Protein ENHANCED PSEUDOMONAS SUSCEPTIBILTY 1-like n=1 Tax=Abrus precatorius TaxID=3816 RepID=A0A8B8LIY7_ABRPR|nr:protein ENHANCED PSEUDOMONAS SUSCEPTIBILTY 1-like [Abrus precatorius]